jgi:serine protease Do/serine protease DegQ
MRRLHTILAVTTVTILAGFAAATGQAQAPVANPPGQVLGAPTLAPLVKRVAPAVVSIAIKGRVAMEQNPLFNDPFFRQFFNMPRGPIEREIQAVGSGVVIDARGGLIVTNNHVIEHADEITVTLSDGRKLSGRKVGTDPATDIAVVRVPARDLATLPMGNSDALQVGDYVIAIGNPFGIGQTVTHGIVSALNRHGLGEGYEDFIQTDAPINPGNSGGALVNLNGELVGINAAIIGPAGGNVGIGFAIPVNLVRRVAEEIVHGKQVQHGHLGVGIQDLTPDLAEAQGLPPNQVGALIAQVQPGSAAARAGLQPGDVVTAVEGVAIGSAADLRNRIGLGRAGEITDLTVLRDGRTFNLRATLAGR